MRALNTLFAHALVLLALLIAAGVLATWRGALWPFDIGFTALITAGGLALVYLGWGVTWLGPVIASAMLGRLWQRIALWPLATAAIVTLHGAVGPTHGFAPLGALTLPGAAILYAVPMALAILVGSAMRETFRRGARPATENTSTGAGQTTDNDLDSRPSSQSAKGDPS